MSEPKRNAVPDQSPAPGHDSPYPVSRLSPPILLLDLAREIAQADQMIANRVDSQLEVIARQIRNLQEDARRILESAKRDKDLHRAQCAFQKRAGHVYHLYRKNDGSLYFSMLSPTDWRQPPHLFCGSFRLEPDFSWTRLEE
ncbi:MAG: DUF2452 domain-containing protein [Deltaproteobacteria bacterium]